MSNYVEMAKKFVCTILTNRTEPTVDGLAEIFEIRSGNKEILISHLKAITSIMNKAIQELESECGTHE